MIIIPREPNNQDPGRQAILFDPEKRRLKLCTLLLQEAVFSQQDFRKAFEPT